MKNLIGYIICIVLFITNFTLFSQENEGTGALQIHGNPANSRVKIKELKLKEKLTEHGVFLNDIPAGNYQIIFKHSRYMLMDSVEVLENDTVVVLGDIVSNEVVSERIAILREEVASQKQQQTQPTKGYTDSALNTMAKELEMQRRAAELNQIKGIYEPTNEEIGYIPPPDTLDLSEEVPGEEVYYVVEEMPEFNNGDPAIEFRKYIARNLKYPWDCHFPGTYTVIVQFLVGKDGYVTDLVNMTPDVPYCIVYEAFRVIANSPRWIPGRQRNEPVPVLFSFPVKFIMK